MGLSLQAISKELRIPRNTVRKYAYAESRPPKSSVPRNATS